MTNKGSLWAVQSCAEGLRACVEGGPKKTFGEPVRAGPKRSSVCSSRLGSEVDFGWDEVKDSSVVSLQG
jgi:hypothetical protein